MYPRRHATVGAVTGAVLATGMLWTVGNVPLVTKAAPRAPGAPELWSIRVWGEARPGRAIKICTDGRLRTGFASLAADFGGAPCAIASLQKHSWGQTYRCTVGGREFGVSTTVDGARDHDFVARSSVTDLDTAQTVYARALRFARLGACPQGWPVGDGTDQQGRRVTSAYMDGSSLPAYPKGSLLRDG
jgi:hypothetical protein